MMTKGLSAVFRTDTASATAPWSAKLTGGSGQQDTTLEINGTKRVMLIRKIYKYLTR